MTIVIGVNRTMFEPYLAGHEVVVRDGAVQARVRQDTSTLVEAIA
jgi:hypothetical protein